MADEDLCIACTLIVTTRQEALQCDGCQKWQHRVCNTGISRPEYRNAVRAGTDIPWKCQSCVVSHMPNFESTRIDEGKSILDMLDNILLILKKLVKYPLDLSSHLDLFNRLDLFK